MKLERRSASQSSRGARWLVCAGGVLGCVLGCTAYPTLKPAVPIDCTADSGYDFLQIDNFETAGANPFYPASDHTVVAFDGAIWDAVAPTEVKIPGGPRCNSSVALEVLTSGHNDWGTLFGFNNFASPGAPRDASAYEGLSFWARAPLGTTTSFTLLLDDLNTSNLIDSSQACSADGGAPATPVDAGPAQMCRNYCVPDAGAGAPTTTYLDPMTGMAVGGSTSSAPPADSCGNSYQAVQVVTSDWRFYTIPFTKLQQGYMPSRVPNSLLMVTGNVPGNGLRTDALTGLVIRFPKEANADLWLDNLDFYRPKSAGSDGGSDAPRM
jgi:hypothetical protein